MLPLVSVSRTLPKKDSRGCPSYREFTVCSLNTGTCGPNQSLRASSSWPRCDFILAKKTALTDVKIAWTIMDIGYIEVTYIEIIMHWSEPDAENKMAGRILFFILFFLFQVVMEKSKIRSSKSKAPLTWAWCMLKTSRIFWITWENILYTKKQRNSLTITSFIIKPSNRGIAWFT